MREELGFGREELGLGEDELSLLETLDHVLDRGLVIAGDVIISVADIDLIYLGLNVLLGSVETVNEVLGKRGGGREELLLPGSPLSLRSERHVEKGAGGGAGADVRGESAGAGEEGAGGE